MESSPEPQRPSDAGVGPIVGVVIIVAIFLIGGVYFLLMETKKEPAPSDQQAAEQ